MSSVSTTTLTMSFISPDATVSGVSLAIEVTSIFSAQPSCLQWRDLEPSSKTVGALSTVNSSLKSCPKASISLVCSASHLVHNLCSTPFSVHVGAVLTVHSPHTCSSGLSSTSWRKSPNTTLPPFPSGIVSIPPVTIFLKSLRFLKSSAVSFAPSLLTDSPFLLIKKLSSE